MALANAPAYEIMATINAKKFYSTGPSCTIKLFTGVVAVL
jgi:hypothetical protein